MTHAAAEDAPPSELPAAAPRAWDTDELPSSPLPCATSLAFELGPQLFLDDHAVDGEAPARKARTSVASPGAPPDRLARSRQGSRAHARQGSGSFRLPLGALGGAGLSLIHI